MLIIQLLVATTHLLLFHGLFSKFKTDLREKKAKQNTKKDLSARANPQHAMNKYDICLK